MRSCTHLQARLDLRPRGAWCGVLVLTALVGGACGSSRTGGAVGDDVIDLDTGRTDVAPDAAEDLTPGLPDVIDDAGDDAGDDADGDGPDAGGGQTGDPCGSGADCASGLCVDVVVGPGGEICTVPCAGPGSCEPGYDCVLVRNSGGDSVQVCVPTDLCLDADGDGYGTGPGCLGLDCDDTADAISPAAPERCNGVDDDCDSIVDTDADDLGAACTTSFPGECARGLTDCIDGAPACVSSFSPTSDETCDGLDTNCNGRTDEAAGCYPDGADCVEDADCQSNRCEDGLCASGDCDGPCPDRFLQVPAGAEGLQSERYVLDFSFGPPATPAPLSSERFQLRLGPAAFRDPR